MRDALAHLYFRLILYDSCMTRTAALLEATGALFSGRNMTRREIEEIAETVLRLAVPGVTPKALLNAVRVEHPAASKKEVVRAAFFAVLEHPDDDVARAARIHAFAMSERFTPEAGA